MKNIKSILAAAAIAIYCSNATCDITRLEFKGRVTESLFSYLPNSPQIGDVISGFIDMDLNFAPPPRILSSNDVTYDLWSANRGFIEGEVSIGSVKYTTKDLQEVSGYISIRDGSMPYDYDDERDVYLLRSTFFTNISPYPAKFNLDFLLLLSDMPGLSNLTTGLGLDHNFIWNREPDKSPVNSPNGGFEASPETADLEGARGDVRFVIDSINMGPVTPTTPVNLSGSIKAPDGSDVCAMVLASGQFMFSCNPPGKFSLADLPREKSGSVKRQIYADGFFPKIDILDGSTDDTVVMTRSGTCPSYNSLYDPAFVPGSAGKRINIAGKVLTQNSQIPVCAMVLANGQHTFSCDGTGSYHLSIPLDNNGQYKLQVYADGFAPTTQTFDEYKTTNNVRMARASECHQDDDAVPYGTTVITHGFLREDDGLLVSDAPWTVSMAAAIAEKAGDATVYLFKDGLLEKQADVGDGANADRTGEVVIVFDWIRESDRPTNGYSEAAGDSLFANLIDGANKRRWSLEKLHFIGHSRGTVVNSEAIQRLLHTTTQGSLPSSISVDRNIHMTTLDPHPWDDDQPTGSANDNEINGAIGIGVVGWKAGDYRVAYIDNYFNVDGEACVLPYPITTHPTGMPYFPGLLDTNNLSGLKSDIPPVYRPCFPEVLYFGKAMNHSGVHAWYHGTIDTNAAIDVDPADGKGGLGIQEYREEWYSDKKGEIDGFYFSSLGGGELPAADSNTLRSVTEDETLYKKIPTVNPSLFITNWLFNGGFNLHGITGNGWLPGWELQGGGGEGNVDSLDSSLNEHLVLKEDVPSRTHNRFFVPENVNALRFHYWIKNNDSPIYGTATDRLVVRFNDTNGPHELFSQLLDRKTSNYVMVVDTDITQYKGTTGTLTFEIVDDIEHSINSKVWVDSIAVLDNSAYYGDSDYDCLPNDIEDSNANGIVDPDETDPNNPDTDSNGLLAGRCGN